jgi:hypothetical protein
VLSVGRGASLVFPAHDSLKRGKVQLAKRVILISEQTLSPSAVLDGIRPDVKYLAAYERLDRSAPSWAKSRSPSMLWGPSSMLNCASDIGNPPIVGIHSRREPRLPRYPTAIMPQRYLASLAVSSVKDKLTRSDSFLCLCRNRAICPRSATVSHNFPTDPAVSKISRCSDVGKLFHCMMIAAPRQRKTCSSSAARTSPWVRSNSSMCTAS